MQRYCYNKNWYKLRKYRGGNYESTYTRIVHLVMLMNLFLTSALLASA